MDKANITVVGAGVIGLTTAIILQEHGYRVSIRTLAIHPRTTSSVAAALWFPFEAFPREKVDRWSIQSYRTYEALTEIPTTGVSMIVNRQLSDHHMDRPPWSEVVGEYSSIAEDLLPQGYTHGYNVTVPLIETPIYLPYLMRRFEDAGGIMIVDPKPVSDLTDVGGASIVVNCTGLGAKALCNDDQMFPIKGQIVRIANPGIEAATSDDESSNAVCYILPRKNDCILGGIAVKNDWSMEEDPDVSDRIINRCKNLDARVATATRIETVVGLRPGRTEVRLEAEWNSQNQLVIHNYGHGGAGFTLAWGCAEDVVALVLSNASLSP